MLAHVAMEQGRKVIDFIACGVKSKRAAVIKCIYTTPEIASVGMTESEAKENGRSPVVGKQLMYTNARTMKEALLKLLQMLFRGKSLVHNLCVNAQPTL